MEQECANASLQLAVKIYALFMHNTYLLYRCINAL